MNQLKTISIAICCFVATLLCSDSFGAEKITYNDTQPVRELELLHEDHKDASRTITVDFHDGKKLTQKQKDEIKELIKNLGTASNTTCKFINYDNVNDNNIKKQVDRFSGQLSKLNVALKISK